MRASACSSASFTQRTAAKKSDRPLVAEEPPGDIGGVKIREKSCGEFRSRHAYIVPICVITDHSATSRMSPTSPARNLAGPCTGDIGDVGDVGRGRTGLTPPAVPVLLREVPAVPNVLAQSICRISRRGRTCARGPRRPCKYPNRTLSRSRTVGSAAGVPDRRKRSRMRNRSNDFESNFAFQSV